MLGFEIINEPIDFQQNNINVLCLENNELYRDFVKCFYDENLEQQNIVLSENYEPIKYKGNVLFVNDYFKLNFSSSQLKKMYDDISLYCTSNLSLEETQLRSKIIEFFDFVIKEYDYDFEYNIDFTLQELFKALSLKPAVDCENLLQSLLDYILFAYKYIKPKLFVMLNLHLYFSSEELQKIYKDICYRDIKLLVIENSKSFDLVENEKVFIIDKDLCQIVDN